MLTHTVKGYRALAIILPLVFRKGHWVNTVSGQNKEWETKLLDRRCWSGKEGQGEVAGTVTHDL